MAKKSTADLARVVVTNPMIGICYMQVCAVADATDEEILTVCNRENPSGTTGGWMDVYRGRKKGMAPGPCADNPERTHFLVSC